MMNLRRLIFLLSVLMVGQLLSAAVTTQRHYLSGTDVSHPRQWQFFCSDGRNSGRWRTIGVPSNWELEGYGAYTYGRFYKTAGLQESKESGRYRTRFTAPEGACYRLVFEGSMTDTRVWIDGREVGPVHQGGFTEFSYDVTSFIRPGKRQTLEVLVSKESANRSVNSAERRADWWLFGGIYRPVYLEILPSDHIRHLAVDARADGSIYVDMEATRQLPLHLSIDGHPVAYDSLQGCYRYPNPELWDPEHPHLYNAEFTLGDGLHTVTRRIGFRTLEFRRYDGLYLNGTRLVVKGTNRHCFNPETGRALSREMSLQDVRLIKQMNMNAVRCHYPSDRHFLELCDSVGLLYLDELPGWQTAYDDTTAFRMVHEMIRRDVSHPCVFLWSNGNEGGWNRSIDTLFSQLDIQHRKVIHPWADFEGLDTHHYPAYQTGAARLHQGQNVFMPTEFLHGKYDKGQGAALSDMWEHWTRSPLFAGGFLWAYVDEAVRRRDLGDILDSDGGNGPDGCMNPYRQPEASFFTIREVWSPIYIDRLFVSPSFDGRVAVDNRYLFTSLSECRMSYRVTDASGSELAQGPVTLPSLAPGEKGYASFLLPECFWKGEVLSLIAFGADGEEVCRWSAPIHRAEEQTIAGAATAIPEVKFDSLGRFEFGGLQGPMPVGMLATCKRHERRVEADGTIVNSFWYQGGIDSIVWRQTPAGLLHMDAVMLNDERGHGQSNFLTDESRWTIGLTFSYPEQQVDSVRWLGRGPYRVWRNRLRGQQFGLWSLAYNNTITGQYNSVEPPLYPEFKGYRSDLRWAEIIAKKGDRLKVYSRTENLYLRLFTPEEAVDQTPGEMGGLQEGRSRRQERSMVRFPEGDISFLLSIPPIQSYKPLEQLGPQSQPDVIRIKSGDEGLAVRLTFDLSGRAE